MATMLDKDSSSTSSSESSSNSECGEVIDMRRSGRAEPTKPASRETTWPSSSFLTRSSIEQKSLGNGSTQHRDKNKAKTGQIVATSVLSSPCTTFPCHVTLDHIVNVIDTGESISHNLKNQPRTSRTKLAKTKLTSQKRTHSDKDSKAKERSSQYVNGDQYEGFQEPTHQR